MGKYFYDSSLLSMRRSDIARAISEPVWSSLPSWEGGNMLGARSRIHIGYTWTFHQLIAFSPSSIDEFVRACCISFGGPLNAIAFLVDLPIFFRALSAISGSWKYSTIVTNCVYPVRWISTYHRDNFQATTRNHAPQVLNSNRSNWIADLRSNSRML